MGERISIHPNSQAVLLYNSPRDCWEDKTESITAIYKAYYYGNHTGYDIYFRGGSGKFFYTHEKVKILSKTKTFDIQKQDVYVEEHRVIARQVDAFERGYFRVQTSAKTYFGKQVRFRSNHYREIYRYFQSLAGYANSVAVENSPLSFLTQRYLRLGDEVPETVLSDYLQGFVCSLKPKKTLILPFDFNQSQSRAITAALHHNISVIEGPPGTGKTQTILNLIANILYAGMNCAVISNNNTAVENVFEKLEEEKLAFLAASLGSRTNVIQFFENDKQALLTEFLERKPAPLTDKELKRMDDLSQTIRKIQDMEVETAEMESQLIELQHEKRYYGLVTEIPSDLKVRLSSPACLSLILRLQEARKLWFYERWFLAFRLRLKTRNADINTLIRHLEQLYYISRTKELSHQIETNRQYLKNKHKEQITKELQTLYRRTLEQHMFEHYSKHPVKTFTADDYKKDFRGFIRRYPVVLSTSHSLLYNAPNGFSYDYLIIDEASQGDLLSSTLAMSCAKYLVVVGDSRQLQQIDEEMLFEQSELLATRFDVPEAYRYSKNSILKSVKAAVKTVPTTLLKEHYRCAPDIINFCNKMFYDGELVAMTRNEGIHIQIIKTVEGNHARSNPSGSGLYNQREMDEIADLLRENRAESVGIITPFRYQADLLSRQFSNDRVEADTIHKFQGRQKDEVILSFVVNSLDQDSNKEKGRLYNFVTNEKLLNVAISRARKKVTAIVADKVYHSDKNIISDFIKYAEYLYGTDVTKESTITSVFDLLYSGQSNILLEKFRNRPNEHKTELLMCEIIDDLLVDDYKIGYAMHIRLGSFVRSTDDFSQEELKYILHPWTHVDFLFYNKVSKQKLFVLEVDGIKYHEQDKKQAEHDRIKDKILLANKIQVYRFKTNQSNEKERLKNILESFDY
jgi:DNA polymerase III delta prime subunit